jgi:hypothetical protein
MNRLISASALTVALLFAIAAFAENPVYIGRHQSNPEDVNAIMQLTKDFRAALMNKNVKQMSTLMFSANILFASPASAATVKMIKDKEDVNFDGVPSGGYGRFAQFVGSTKGSIDERFYNIQITQDGHLAWVIFDFEFVQDSKVARYGVEAWQVVKNTGDKWKILSVVWSSHDAPK